jgi:hypothetical protein
MPLSREQARQLTTRDEQELVEESFHPRVRSFTASQLRRKVERARRLRDKYQDLARRQHESSKRGRQGGDRPREATNVRTDRKVTLFSQTLERLERRLAQLTADAAGAVTAKPDSAAGTAPRGGVARSAGKSPKTRKAPPSGAQAAGAKAKPPRQDKLAQTRGKAVRGHTKARGRRTQSRRDSR